MAVIRSSARNTPETNTCSDLPTWDDIYPTTNTRSVSSADLYGDSFASMSVWTDDDRPVCGDDVTGGHVDSYIALQEATRIGDVLEIHADNGSGMRSIHVMSAPVWTDDDGVDHTPGAPIDRRPGHRQSCPAAQVPGKGTVTVRTIVTGAIVRHETTTGRPADQNGASLARKAAATRRGDAARQAKAERQARLDAMPSLPAGAKARMPRKPRKATAVVS